MEHCTSLLLNVHEIAMMCEILEVYDELKGRTKIQKLAFNMPSKHSSERILLLV